MPTTPSNPSGYSGGAIWGSTPVVDAKHGSLYVATGNNYTVPLDVEACIQMAMAMGQSDSVCNSVDNYGQDYFDSIVALDLNTGAIKWGTRTYRYDAWNSSCQLMLGDCPMPKGTDTDFAAGPNLFDASINGKQVEIVGAGQKTGTYWALNPTTGALLWNTKVGPGHGGRQWGTATDGQRVYMSFPDLTHKTYTLQPSGTSCNGGSWTALDAATGNFVWQTATLGTCTNPKNGTTGGCSTEGPVSVANGVVYAGHRGRTWLGRPSFCPIRQVHAGAAVVGDTIYWGSGYVPTRPGSMYAFTLLGS
jgi:polyvinyl alcohol dehydrogenase (cytochrome)